MSPGRDLAARASAAIAAGVAFLTRSQRPNGELSVKKWRPATPEPFHDPSIFGTALITSSLAGVPETEALRNRACDFLYVHRERFGVWRHWTRGHEQFRYVPPDLDDTSVACVALRRNGRPVPANRALLLANRDDRGLFFSWISLRARWVPNPAYWWISLAHLLHPVYSTTFYTITPSERDDVDAVVNSNVLYYLGRSADTELVVAYLLRVLREHSETTCDKWYDNPFVVWYFFSRALRLAGEDAAGTVLGRLRGTEPQGALDRALAICVQLDWDLRPDDDAVRALLDAQLPSGAWPLGPFYKGRDTRWGSEELTTGFCVEALSRWIGAGRG